MAPLPTPSDITALQAPVSDASTQNRALALAALNHEINDHLDQQRQQSYLDKAVSWVTSPFHHEGATLATAEQVYQRAIKDKSVSSSEITAAATADQKATGLNQNIDQIGGELIKTGSLFLRGRIGVAASIVSYGLSQAKPSDSGSAQLADLTLGGIKGGLTQGLFSKIGSAQKIAGIPINFAMKGVAMGTTGRSLDLGLTRSTWTDPTNGTFSLDHGLAALHAGVVNKKDLISDVVVFGVAGGLTGAADHFSGGALTRNKFLATTLTGAAFGATTGGFNEYHQQQQKGEKFDLSKIIGAAALHGTVDGIAAIPGAIQGLPPGSMRLSLGENLSSAVKSLGPKTNVNLAESLSLPSLSGAKPEAAAADASPVAQAHVSEAAQNDVTIFDALKKAPEGDRLAVWKEQVAQGRSANLVAASNALHLLPAGDKLAAVEHTLQVAPEHADFMLKEVNAEQLPDLTRSIFNNTSGAQRTELLNQIYVGRSSPEVAESTIKAASGATGKDLDVVRTWFRDLPEPRAEWTPGKAPTPVRDALSDKLDPQFLGRLLFEGRENGVDANKLAKDDPQLVRKLVQVTDLSGADHMQNVAKVVSQWQSTGSLEASTRVAIAASSGAASGQGVEALPDVLSELAAKAGPQDLSRSITQLRDAALGGNEMTDGKGTTGKKAVDSESQVWLAATTAARIGKINGNSAQVEAGFFKPVVEALSDPNMDYNWRLSTARILSNLERTGDLPEGAIKLPELRMPAVAGLTEAEQGELRSQSEAALRGDKPLSTLFGDGPLGTLLPQVFGSHEQGGIVDRPQHALHDFTLDKHTEGVVDRVRENPQFASLSPKDQTDLLWAAVLHDVGKRPGIVDPGHEAVSANIGWGVLRTLGYSPARIARITNLISSHSDLSFQPEHPTAAKLDDPNFIDQAAVKYNHPAAATQLRILNESDIRSVKANDGLWSDDIGSQLDQITTAIGARSHELSGGRLPILTTDLPQRSGLFSAPSDYAVLGQVTQHLEGNFFGKLPVLESPQNSISGSLLTPENSVLFDPDARMVPLYQGAPESVSQAYRGSTGSGEATGWQGHLDLFKDWPTSSEARKMASSLAKPLTQLGFGTDKVSPLDDLRQQLSPFDSVSALTAATGPDSALSRGYAEVVKALTTDGAGNKITDENEIKLNNPTLVGLGVYRRGQSVALSGASASDLASILRGSPAPDWLNTVANPGDNSLFIPKSVWSQLHLHDLPIVVLDP